MEHIIKGELTDPQKGGVGRKTFLAPRRRMFHGEQMNQRDGRNVRKEFKFKNVYAISLRLNEIYFPTQPTPS